DVTQIGDGAERAVVVAVRDDLGRQDRAHARERVELLGGRGVQVDLGGTRGGRGTRWAAGSGGCPGRRRVDDDEFAVGEAPGHVQVAQVGAGYDAAGSLDRVGDPGAGRQVDEPGMADLADDRHDDRPGRLRGAGGRSGNGRG